MAGIFEGQANFIKFMLTDQCARPWFVYAETFFPAFLNLLLTVTLLDLNDLVRAYGENIAEGGGGRGRKGKTHRARIKTTGAVPEHERYMQKGLKTLLVVTQPLENIGYAWLLYSAVDQGFSNWQTLIETAPYCEKNDLWGPLSRSRTGGFVTINPSGFPLILTTLTQNRSSWPTTTITADIPFGKMSVLFAATVGAPPGGITGVKIRVKVTDGFLINEYESDEQDIPYPTTKDFVISETFTILNPGGGTVQWQLVGPAVPAGIWCGKGRVILFRTQG